MSGDLVQRLRDRYEGFPDKGEHCTLMILAADRIEALEAALRKHRAGHEALGEFCSICWDALDA